MVCFFSSRRRHTRWPRDWSSDVCSSDLLFIIPSILLLITACSGSAAEDKIYDHLEEAYELEANFEERQKELLALEKEGQELYAEIVDLAMKDMEEIK